MMSDAQNLSRLEAIDFAPDISRLTEGFVGREWLFGEIDAWLKREDQRFFILTGEPGVGKSAIAARLTQVRKDITAHHFCIAGRNSTVVPGTALRSLAAQLGDRLPGYGEALANTVKPIHLSVQVDIDVKIMTGGQITGVVINHLHAGDPEEELDILLRAPLAELPMPPAPVLLLVDSLDEAVTHRGEVNLVTLLAEVDDLPSWVRFVCTSRPEQRVLRYFDGLAPYILAAESQMNLEDVGRYIAYRVAKDGMPARLPEADVTPEPLADRVAQLAEGNFLYAKVLLNDVEAGRQPLDDLEALPRSLDEIYHGFLNRFTVREWEDRYQPLLGVLAVAQEPLVEAQLASFSGLRRTKVRQYLGVVQQFLDERQDEEGRKTYTLFHQSLRDYLLEEERSKGFWCAPEDGHESITDHYSSFWDRWADCDLYGLRHLPLHLMRAGQHAALHTLLLSFDWLQAKLHAADISALISDYDLLDLEDTERQSFGYIQSALQLSTHILSQDKTQLAAQLLGRLLSFEDDQIQRLLACARRCRDAPWLRPLTACLESPRGPLLRTLLGHTSWVNAVAVTPDGEHVISGSADSTLKVWEVESGREVRTLEGHTSAVLAVAVTPDGRHIISGSKDNTLRIWELDTGRAVRTLQGHFGGVYAVAVAPDGRHVISGSWDNTLKVWELEGGQLVQTLKGHTDDVETVVVTPDGKYIISGSFDNTLKVWELEGGREVRTLRGHFGGVHVVAVTPGGQHVISGSSIGVLKVWEVDSWTEVWTLDGHTDRVSEVAVTPDGKYIISGSFDKTLKVWELEGGQLVQTLKGIESGIHAVTVTPDGGKVISGSRTLKVWELEDGHALRPSQGHTNTVSVVAVTPDGQHAISGSQDNTLIVWEVESGRAVHTLIGHKSEIRSVAVTPDGQHVVSGSWDHTLIVWEVDGGRKVHTLKGHTDSVETVVVTPDGQHVISGSNDCDLKVWELEGGHTVRTLQGHSDEVHVLVVTQDGKYIISGAGGYDPVDTTLKVWEMEGGHALYTLQGHTGRIGALVVTPNGKSIISGSYDGALVVWELEGGRKVHTLKGHSRPVTALAMTTDGCHVVSGSWDSTLKVWELEGGREVRTLEGHTSEIYAISVTPDGCHVVSGSWDNTLKVWELQSGRCLASYLAEGGIMDCAISTDGKAIVAGDEAGRVHFLRLEGLT
jgi:WD40 repeat protein